MLSNTYEAIKRKEKHACKRTAIENTFKELQQDNKQQLSGSLIKHFGLKRGQLDYIIITFELAEKENSEVSELLKDLGSKQQACIKRMIKFVRKYKALPKFPMLNRIYKEVNYIC